MKGQTSYCRTFFSSALGLFFILHFISLSSAGEETYSIDLVKTPETETRIHKLDDKKVLSEVYTVQEGEWVVNVLRRKGLLNQYKIHDLLALVKKLNASIQNLDLVYPGEKIVLPVKIVPIGHEAKGKSISVEEKILQPSEIKGIDFDHYTVKMGDELIKIVKGRYNIPQEYLYNEYLDLVKQLNPSIKNPDRIYVGQKIRLPVYSPEIVRKPIAPVESNEPEPYHPQDDKPNPLSHDLSLLFLEIGEEWVQTGKHFIPLKSGGQIDLNAVSFPIINLRSGRRILVDLNNKLPDKMGALIESNWENYRVVHLLKEDCLRSSFDKILRECNYPKVYKKDEHYESDGIINTRISGDWIIELSKNTSVGNAELLIINLLNNGDYTPQTIKAYLRTLKINVIDFPPQKTATNELSGQAEILEGGKDPASLIETLLGLAGRSFSAQKEIPVYQGNRRDFKLVINADFFLENKGKESIIDITGLAPEVILFLNEHHFSVLSLPSEKDPQAFVEKVFKFLEIQFHRGPHYFMAKKGDESKNIRLSLPGIVFSDSHGNPIFATPLHIPYEIALFISQRGFSILNLSPFSSHKTIQVK
ncbi:MAG: LysM peptidoglycan-binding domain-containing protein [Deltaproteobacteria bacterium]|nr:LysM peptidoglycan-binding domain-containing protein [Deltaproteobacteria bacterium]